MLPSVSDLLKICAVKTSRSGGSGGQHVNKVSSKVELIFNISNAYFLTDEEKLLLNERLAGRLDKEGLLHIVAQEGRSQFMNKQTAVVKLVNLITANLKVAPQRKPKKVPRAMKEKRLANKLATSFKKENRKRPGLD